MEDIEPNRAELVLPSRPIPASKGSFKEYEIISNHYKVNLARAPKNIYTWFFKSEPQIAYDNRDKRNAILKSITQELTNQLGQYVDTGFEIFSSENKSNEKTLQINTYVNDEMYVITLENKRVLNLEQTLASKDQKIRNIPIRFLNAQTKKILRSLNYYQLGKLPKFFQMNEGFKIEGTQLTVFSGFQTSFCMYQAGLFLKIDTANKIINNSTVLEMIDQMYRNRQGDKSEMRQYLRDQFKGKVVCATYGNFKTYPILDFDFDNNVDTENFTDQKGNSFTMYDHYAKRYNITIQNKEQPLIVSEMKNLKNEIQSIKLAPELMKLTGVPEDINDFQRRSVLTRCNKKPDTKVKEIKKLINDMAATRGQKYLKELGIELQEKPHSFMAKKLMNPQIQFGGGDKLPDHRVTQFSIQNEKYARHSKEPLRWAVIYTPDGFDKNGFFDLFKGISTKQAFPVAPPEQFQIDTRGKPTDEIKAILNRELSKTPQKFHIILMIMSKRFKNEYSKLKEECTVKYRIPMQWVNNESLQKSPGSKVAKIVQQMCAKVGGYAWEVKSMETEQDKVYDKPFILIGANVAKDKHHKGKTIASVVCGVNRYLSSFFSHSEIQQDGSDLIGNIKEIIKSCLKKFYQNCGIKPARIIYLREGVTPSAQNQFIQFELENFLKSFSELDASYKPEIAVCLLDRKPTQKFFVDSNNKITNPQYGTVIDSDMVGDNYEFKMIPQVVPEALGCAIPTQYTFIYNSTTLNQGSMLNLFFSQCFNYSNWTGPVRVPSVVQYAIKLGQINSNSIHADIPDKLSEYLWYL